MHMAFLSRGFKNLKWYSMTESIENFGFRCFFVAQMLKTVRVKMWVNRLTHTLTHTRKCPDRSKEYRRGGFTSSPVLFCVLFRSHDLCHKATHGLCGLVLLLPGGVGVGAECESGIVVAERRCRTSSAATWPRCIRRRG